MLEIIQPNSIDSIITDPPYELNFMNKGWDNSGIAFQSDTWKQCYEVLKPGGYLLAFGGSRTFHRIACAIEDAGFEIRDTIMWLYGEGFPKSHNIGLDIDKLKGCPDRGHRIAVANRNHPDGTLEPNGEQLEPYKTKTEEAHKWNGWGTALKPSYEPIIVARKPLDGTVAKNCLKWGVGGINIESCRVGDENISIHNTPIGTFAGGEYGRGSDTENYRNNVGRFPANTILTYDETDYKEVCGGFPYTKDYGGSTKTKPNNNIKFQASKETYINRYNESGSASRYFYCAKASKKDRDEGLKDFQEQKTGSMMANINGNMQLGGASLKGQLKEIQSKKNIHPTVKPTELMQYLVRLVSPNGSTILDCFNGSGSTGKAVMYENKERDSNYKYVGIEITPEYLPIAKARIEYAIRNNLLPTEEEIEQHADGQTNIFDFIGE